MGVYDGNWTGGSEALVQHTEYQRARDAVIRVPPHEGLCHFLNLGCGTDVRKGFVNMDHVAAAGVDIVHDMEVIPWPFKDGEFEYVLSLRSLEHVEHIVPVVREIARVLQHGGVLQVRVPYGLRSLYDPQHYRAFNKISMNRFCGKDSSCDSAPLFHYPKIRYHYMYPFKWHVKKYMGIAELPFGRPYEMTFTMVRR